YVWTSGVMAVSYVGHVIRVAAGEAHEDELVDQRLRVLREGARIGWDPRALQRLDVVPVLVAAAADDETEAEPEPLQEDLERFSSPRRDARAHERVEHRGARLEPLLGGVAAEVREEQPGVAADVLQELPRS